MLVNTLHREKPALLFGLFLFSLSFTSHAESGIDVVGKMAIGEKTMDLKIRDRSFSPSFTSLKLSVTGVKGAFFTTLDHEVSIKDAIESDSKGLIFYSRKDSNLTFGYALSDHLNTFIGYRTGETEAFYTANNSAFGNSSEGPFIGVSSSYYLKDTGSIGVSLAIAKLTGKVSLTEPYVDTTAFKVGDSPPADINGSALGYSFGISWSSQTSDNMLYSLSAKIQRFEFDDEVVYGGLDLSYEENYNTIAFAITKYF